MGRAILETFGFLCVCVCVAFSCSVMGVASRVWGVLFLVWFVFLMRALQLRESVPRSFMLTIRDNEYICYSLCYCFYLLTVRDSVYLLLRQ